MTLNGTEVGLNLTETPTSSKQAESSTSNNSTKEKKRIFPRDILPLLKMKVR